MGLPALFMGTTREHYILLFGLAGVIGLTAGIVGAWIGGFLGARRAVRKAQLEAPAATLQPAQLAPIMQALDAISVEVERISEAQRYTARILSERPAAKLTRDQRNITPH